MNYYNEFDPFAAAWLRELIKAGVIPKGDVDERSITELSAKDLTGYTQCHFFAGIGGWSHALQLAGWPNDRPVWTGSCPCQPFSSAGKQKGKEDDRHLWPVWFNLIRQSKPSVVFGEQVSAAIRHNWWDDVADDLEGEGYTTRAEIRPACSVGAPHKRDRLWFVAHAEGERSGRASGSGCETTGRSAARNGLQLGRTSDERGNVADAEVNGRRQSHENAGRGAERVRPEQGAVFGDNNGSDVAHPNDKRSNGQSISVWERQKENPETYGAGQLPAWSSGVEWINCPDGKQRIAEPGIPLLAHGVSNRVGKLRGYGNAIVPQVAAEVIKSFMNR